MEVNFWRRPSTGRSAVHAKHGLVASSQPLASSSGLKILQAGGNACDAAIAMAAVLNVVEPMSTGIGGDAFALIYIPGEKKPFAINGSGYSPKALTYDMLTSEEGLTAIPNKGILPITVPGAVSAWQMINDKFGKISWSELLQPAINFAQNGFPVAPVVAQVWHELLSSLIQHEGFRRTYLIDETRAPKVGELFYQPQLGQTLQDLAKYGSDGFYKGNLANRTIEFLQNEGSKISASDFSEYSAEWTEPISQEIYNNILWEHGPNGQGLVALQILTIAEEYDIAAYPLNSPEYLHCLIEAKKLAFSDAYAYLADPHSMTVEISEFLDDKYAQSRSSQINPRKAIENLPSILKLGTDTVYLTAIDSDGMAISFINSLYEGFGSGIVDPETGIAFQNRGAGFTLQKNHPNQYQPRKRPFHTIIPAMVTDPVSGILKYSFGVMGGHHQPQGHAQVFLNLVLHGMNPQEAISTPRFHHNQNLNVISVEQPISINVRKTLRKMGHNIIDSVGVNFGGGQIIQVTEHGSYIGGSDPRKDGQAQGY